MKRKIDWKFFPKILVGIGYLVLTQCISVQELTIEKNNGWQDQFDMQISNQASVFDHSVLNPTVIEDTKAAVTRYHSIAFNGGWPSIPNYSYSLKIGMEDPAVPILRERLLISGDLVSESAAGLSRIFDTYVEAAVKRFQSRHGLFTSGIVDVITRTAMNISVSQRLKQLSTNLERLQKIMKKTANEKRFVIVNIPAAQIEAIENGIVIQRHTAIVGKTDRQTPILDAKIHEVIFNPFWTVPRSIVIKDLIPIIRKNRDYLTENDIHIYDTNGQEISPHLVDWNTDQAASFLFRQNPGKINAMSSTKINFHNPYSVYMHDTPLQEQFNDLIRFDSSGCVRVQNVRDFNLWILKNTPGWGRLRMENIILSRKNTPVSVKDPVPLHFIYITAWGSHNGIVQFRDDVYNRDNL